MTSQEPIESEQDHEKTSTSYEVRSHGMRATKILGIITLPLGLAGAPESISTWHNWLQTNVELWVILLLLGLWLGYQGFGTWLRRRLQGLRFRIHMIWLLKESPEDRTDRIRRVIDHLIRRTTAPKNRGQNWVPVKDRTQLLNQIQVLITRGLLPSFAESELARLKVDMLGVALDTGWARRWDYIDEKEAEVEVLDSLAAWLSEFRSRLTPSIVALD